ncbi:putative Single-stranded DNA-binding protein 2 [Hypsibius exemplaris]|uniref:Single-stranded DNA-binding protein 2 n=1 Tax=Hypsibius exemplaris TaxID=2072580 RepID=A0A1W0XER5_HYPEX|nr:putative Single-stranded DNA-binding protein 2 [Hypsibius exemplaris]
MYPRKQAVAIPSDAQAKEKLIVYVYEYLHHMGAKNAADTFLTEINWNRGQISPNEAPGFLHSWWCVFWDLYCAAPERRESHPHSKEASSFHDYTNIAAAAGHPLSPNMNGMGFPPGQGPPHLQHNMGDGPIPPPSPSLGHQLGGPGPDGSMPPGFFQGSHIRPPNQMMPHGGMMHMAGGPPPSNLQHHPSQLQHGQPPQGPPTPGGHMQNGPMGPNSHPGMGMMMQPGGGSPFGPRYGGPNSNRTSPGARMNHPGQQQMDFPGGPPGSMMMSDGPPQGMMIGRSPGGGMSRGGVPGMPPSPMPPGGYGPPQRMHNPGLGPGGSPSNPGGGMGMSPMHQHQRPWHQGSMGHYSPPSPPNGSYMMMGPPPHMQSPSQGDGSMELKHSPSVNGSNSSVSGAGQNQNSLGQSMDNDEYSALQYSAANAASAASNASQD